MMRVEDVKRPLKKGELYLVPCIVNELEDITYITPVLLPIHDDIESGQIEKHYHVDYRFVIINKNSNNMFPVVKQDFYRRYQFAPLHRPTDKDGILEYIVLPVRNEEWYGITPNRLVKTNLHHKCIHKGKCPHKGFDLSQVSSVNGIITCPMHGLQFDAITGELITDLNRII